MANTKLDYSWARLVYIIKEKEYAYQSDCIFEQLSSYKWTHNQVEARKK